MAEVFDYDVVDDNNTARFPEGQPPDSVNDGARANEGITARWYQDENGSLVSTGTGGAYILSTRRSLSGGYFKGLTLQFEANHANVGGGSDTLAAGGQAAGNIKFLGSDLVAGDISVGQQVRVTHDGTNWQMISPVPISTSGFVPTSRQVNSGTGLEGGGDLTQDRTISVSNQGIDTAQLADASVTMAKINSSVVLGKLLAVHGPAIKTNTWTGTTTFGDVTGLSVAVTPLSTVSKFLVFAQLFAGATGNQNGYGRLLRDAVILHEGGAAGTRPQVHTIWSALNQNAQSAVMLGQDSPNTTSPITYKVQARSSSGTVYINRTPDDTDGAAGGRGVSVLVVLEYE